MIANTLSRVDCSLPKAAMASRPALAPGRAETPSHGAIFAKEGPSRALTPAKAMRAKCLDCCAGHAGEVRACPAIACALWPYRMGRNPNRARRAGADA